MTNMVTIKVTYGNNVKNRIGDFMHKHGMIRVAYDTPLVDRDGNEIGRVCAIVGTKKALWLMKVLFERELLILPFEVR